MYVPNIKPLKPGTKWTSEENTITYEIKDDWTYRVTTFPNGTIFRKALHPAGEPDISQYPALNKKKEEAWEGENEFLRAGIPATAEEAAEAEEAMKPPVCKSCEQAEPLADLKYIGHNEYYHDGCKAAEAEEAKPVPTISYKVKDDTKYRVETYPNGTVLSKPLGPASRHEKIVALAKETYDRVLNITDDHNTACEMMADVFYTLLPRHH